MSQEEQGCWDGPCYRVRTTRFEAAFLLDAGEELESVDNVDVLLTFEDGSRWSATVVTVAQVETLMDRWAVSGEALGGRYFWCSDGLIVRDSGIDSITQVLTGLVDSGEFTEIFKPVDA